MPSVAADAILNSLTIRQIQSLQFNPGSEVQREYLTGGLTPQSHSIVRGAPTVTFQSHDLAGIVAGIGAGTGLSLASTTITLPFQLRASGGSFTSGSAHQKIAATGGLFWIQSLQCSQGQNAVATVQGNLHSSDGLTIPYTFATSQALGSQAFSATHTLAPVSCAINGGASAQLSGVTSVTVSPGLSVEPELVDGALYPTTSFIVRLAPMVEVTFESVTAMVSNGAFGAMTALTGYFRKRADGGTFVAAGTGEHISYALGDGMHCQMGVSGSGTNKAATTVTFYGEALTLSATATIS